MNYFLVFIVALPSHPFFLPFLCLSFPYLANPFCLGFKIMLTSQNELRVSPPFSMLWDILHNMRMICFLNDWQSLPHKTVQVWCLFEIQMLYVMQDCFYMFLEQLLVLNNYTLQKICKDNTFPYSHHLASPNVNITIIFAFLRILCMHNCTI